MDILEGFNITQDQMNMANQNDLNKHFIQQNKNLWLYPDQNASLILRYATIQNPSISNAEEKNSLDLTNVYNPQTGGVTISWFQNNNSGVVAKEQSSGSWELNKKQNTNDIKDRTQPYNVSSTIPNVRLSSPFIWTGDDGRCCGFNYVPPNNSIVLMANKEFNQPVMLGFVPSNPSVLYPVLKPGEVSISGYGNNFIHWSQSDKISIYCKSEAGKVDIDDYDYLKNNTGKVNLADCELEININANDRFIEIKANEDPKDSSNNDFDKNSYNAKQVNGKQFTKILITPTDIEIRTTDANDNEAYIRIAPDTITQSVTQLNLTTQTQITKDNLEYKIQKEDEILNTKVINQGILNTNETICTIKDDVNTLETYNSVNRSKTTLTDVNNNIAQTELNRVDRLCINQYIKEDNNETYYKSDSENIKIKTKYYTVEAEEVNINSKNTTNIWSDNELNLQVPFNNTTRIDIDGNQIELNTDHEEDDESVHKQKNPYNNNNPMDYKVNISGCNVKITEHESNHGEVI